MSSIDDLMREVERLRTENVRLEELLRMHGIAIPDEARGDRSDSDRKSETSSSVTKSHSLSEKVALFFPYFRDAETCMPDGGKGKTEKQAIVPFAQMSGSRASVSSQREGAQIAFTQNIARMTQMPSKRICAAARCSVFIRWVWMKPAAFSPLISMKLTGART